MSNTRKPRRNRRRPQGRRHEPNRLGESHEAFHRQFAVMQAADAAEARGDAPRAVEIMESMPVGPDGKPFWRPWRVRRLAQLIEFRDVLPRWAISRWILAQTLQQLDASARDRGQLALRTAIDVRGGESMLSGVDDVDAHCKVIDNDWVYRQQYLYDLGGLRHFLDTAAAAELVAGADRIADWADAAMGGYRLQAVSPVALAWEDLATGQRREVLNLGSAALVEEGDCVIGRVVPTDHGAMFESSPLRVADDVARQVAESPSAWVDALGPWTRELALQQGDTAARVLLAGEHDFGLLTDVPEVVWRAVATANIDTTQVYSGVPLAVIADAVQLFELVATTPIPDEADMNRVWPWIAAVLVVPHVAPVLGRRLGAADADSLHFVADRLVEPAATLCRRLAESRRQAS